VDQIAQDRSDRPIRRTKLAATAVISVTIQPSGLSGAEARLHHRVARQRQRFAAPTDNEIHQPVSAPEDRAPGRCPQVARRSHRHPSRAVLHIVTVITRRPGLAHIAGPIVAPLATATGGRPRQRASSPAAILTQPQGTSPASSGSPWPILAPLATVTMPAGLAADRATGYRSWRLSFHAAIAGCWSRSAKPRK
jgi:hypothetical protein